MVQKRTYFFLFIFFGILVVPTDTQPFFRSLISKSTNLLKFGMRGWVVFALEGTFGHYVMRCEHAKEMKDASPKIMDFVHAELAKAGIKNSEKIPVKVDTDHCLIYSTHTPESQYDSCGHCIVICRAFMAKELEQLLKKQAAGTLSEMQEDKLNKHRYFIRHQGRVIANNDHHRLLVSRLALPVLVFISSYLGKKGISRLLQKTKIESVLDSNLLTFAVKKSTSSLLTLGYELMATLTVLKWYYQRRQQVADKQIDPLHTQSEVLQAGVSYFEKLVQQGAMRTNLSDFFLFENSTDYEKQAHNLKEQLAQHYDQQGEPHG